MDQRASLSVSGYESTNVQVNVESSVHKHIHRMDLVLTTSPAKSGWLAKSGNSSTKRTFVYYILDLQFISAPCRNNFIIVIYEKFLIKFFPVQSTTETNSRRQS